MGGAVSDERGNPVNTNPRSSTAQGYTDLGCGFRLQGAGLRVGPFTLTRRVVKYA